ncbi:TRAP transporter small permease [Pusillimonas noertemannii]|uniref:TRAP transporter small permease protein n=1 Tax=Pusillimonas noertemannii TaxID=305977 RepID=A0A2U1CL24_9BURK|nr:TRAP transporter small permease [Pusillimonas noertemannii]NYT69240.1 TRAP transporter small permease [Pusillimonas noertemannii]PVY61707.1 TRAP-type C4-dicarboxylate transport system permease small subunit [Pusillimonas noertemannii]TFL09646.1 TRAP transporter small permease [Pusillimonas noertemannii]
MSNFINALSRVMAWFGCLVLVLIALTSVISIIGRALSGFGLGPIPGDFELVEIGTALAIFCFLPWAHLRRAHASVDLLSNVLSSRTTKAVEFLADLLMLACWAVLTWRMGVGMMDYQANGEVSFVLQIPVWWGYAASFPFAVMGCLVYLWRIALDVGCVATVEPSPRILQSGVH